MDVQLDDPYFQEKMQAIGVLYRVIDPHSPLGKLLWASGLNVKWMNRDMDDIGITVIYGDEEYLLRTYAGGYRNLMTLIRDQVYVDGFGACGGQGRCATCLVQVMPVQQGAFRSDGSPAQQGGSPLEGNEANTLRKLGMDLPGVRLSCQVLIDPAADQLVVKVLEGY